MKHFDISREFQETPYFKLNDALLMSRDWNTHISDNTLIAVGSQKGAAHVFSKVSADLDSFCESLLKEVEANENPRSYEYDEVVGYLVSGMSCMEVSCARPGEINIAVDPRNREYLKIIDNKIQIMKRADNNSDYYVSYQQELSEAEMQEFKKKITNKMKFIQSFYDLVKSVH
ncbi:hypothetical protein [Brucella gallinifaecis]|uniref:hypothetical protein n=1 Tax=Brucella gallinifaecis TaxID=215590 RepID=UPI00235E8144|nr:hypothetical protein [Brucella gallinifaecis]